VARQPGSRSGSLAHAAQPRRIFGNERAQPQHLGFDGGAIWDTLRLIVWTIGVISPAAGMIIIAGDSAFGDAGSLIHG